ncbi:MAG: iron-containing alcohol dehydrogenase [Verrucomicrobiaceae bacterium]|nr:MAG: iron-containing alcohol dehydrogenase [Verrucomicrobiaceae bacterium]
MLTGAPDLRRLLSTLTGESVPDFVADFSHAPGTRVVFGSGEVERTGVFARTMGSQRALVVTDRGIADAGHLDRVLQSLSAAGVEWSAFMGVVENPTTDTVDACVATARENQADLLIGLGGGSSMDTAKGCNFLLTNGGKMSDYHGTGRATRPMLPLIAIPTTAGTGSECQSYALISDAKTHAKMACGDKKAAARIAILDPDLTATVPTGVARVTGIDAIAHAVESAVSTRRTPVSTAYSRTAFSLLASAYQRVLDDPQDLEARSAMLLGAALAGVAIENSMLGAAHSSANPLTAHFGIVHGEAVAMMLPHVVQLNTTRPEALAEYARLGEPLGIGGDDFADFLTGILTKASLPLTTPAGTLTTEKIPQLATEAAAQWTAQFNPAPVDAAAFAELYGKVLPH